MSATATRRILLALSAVVAVVAAVVVYLVVIEQDDRNKLQGVDVVGPCRATYAAAIERGATDREAVIAATRNDECEQQSRLLFAACVRRELHPACTLAKTALMGHKREKSISDDKNDKARQPSGGDASSAPPGSSPPSPSPPGDGPSPNPDPPGNPEPPSTPPPPDEDGPVGDLLDDVCHVNVLGVRVCL